MQNRFFLPCRIELKQLPEKLCLLLSSTRSDTASRICPCTAEKASPAATAAPSSSLSSSPTVDALDLSSTDAHSLYLSLGPFSSPLELSESSNSSNSGHDANFRPADVENTFPCSATKSVLVAWVWRYSVHLVQACLDTDHTDSQGRR